MHIIYREVWRSLSQIGQKHKTYRKGWGNAADSVWKIFLMTRTPRVSRDASYTCNSNVGQRGNEGKTNAF